VIDDNLSTGEPSLTVEKRLPSTAGIGVSCKSEITEEI
jgi:hypothetical protein